jgi:hypothetical protein
MKPRTTTKAKDGSDIVASSSEAVVAIMRVSTGTAVEVRRNKISDY